MSTTTPVPSDDAAATGTTRATVGEQIFSFWRPLLVNIVVPVLITVLFGAHYGFGSGALLVVTRVLGWVALVLWAWWFFWAVGMFLRHGISLNPNWRKRPLPPWKDRETPYPVVEPVTTGAYRYSTAPMFFGVYSGLVAAGFLLSYWVFLFAVPFIVGMSLWIRYRERPMLLGRHPELREWLDGTPKLIPYRIVTGLFQR